MKRYTAFIAIFCFLILEISPLLSVDEMYNLSEFYSPKVVEVEESRKICFYPLRTATKEIGDMEYLSRGIPSILVTELRKLGYVYDENIVYNVIRHSMGNPKDPSNPKNKVDTAKTKNKRILDGENKSKVVRRKLEYNQEEIDSILSNQTKVFPANDPRYIPLEVEYDRENKNPPEQEAVYRISSKRNCNYAVTGEFSLNGTESVSVQFELTNLFNGKIEKFSQSTSVKRAFQELTPLVTSLKKYLMKKDLAELSVDTKSLVGALVFVDGIYLGKTPLQNVTITSGSHELLVTYKDYSEYKSEFSASVNQHKLVSADLIPNPKTAFISVESEPSGAEVFIGIEKIGETPLKKIAVSPGKNRLRVGKLDYIDHFQGIDLDPGKEEKFKVSLKVGKSEPYYLSKDYVFLDYTHKDFLVYSVYGALLFYAGNIYLQLQANRLTDSLRPQIQIQSLSQAQVLYGQNPDLAIGVYMFEEYKIRKVKAEAEYYNNLAGNIGFGRTKKKLHGGAMLYGALFMVVTGLTFYYLGLDDESIDIGFDPGFTTPVAGVASEAKGHILYNFRF
jgi:hypothetical protein